MIYTYCRFTRRRFLGRQPVAFAALWCFVGERLEVHIFLVRDHKFSLAVGGEGDAHFAISLLSIGFECERPLDGVRCNRETSNIRELRPDFATRHSGLQRADSGDAHIQNAERPHGTMAPNRMRVGMLLPIFLQRVVFDDGYEFGPAVPQIVHDNINPPALG